MSDPRLPVMEAIARQRLMTARYNGETIRLAPHLLFERRGDLFIRALNLGKTWRSDEEPRLGQFKLTGLGEISVLDEAFEPLPSFDAAAPHPSDVTLLAVERS